MSGYNFTMTLRPYGNVRLTYFDSWYGQLTKYFLVKQTEKAGYVWERLPGGKLIQVCERLDSRGNTLISDRAGLLALIRKEWRRRQRQSTGRIA